MISRFSVVVAVILLIVRVKAHTVITLPGWRGDNLITNETFPYGMQWTYPCEHTYLFLLGSCILQTGLEQERSVSLFC